MSVRARARAGRTPRRYPPTPPGLRERHSRVTDEAGEADLPLPPIAGVEGVALLGDRLRLTLEVDGIAAPQGRAFDAAALLDVHLTTRWFIGAGYRTVEGGADVDTVYNFSWLNAVVARTGVAF